MTDHEGKAGGFAAGVAASLAHRVIDPILTAVRAEIETVRAEITDRVLAARSGALLTAAGGVLAIVTTALLAALVVALLLLALPLWASVGITFVLFAVATALVLRAGVRGLQRGIPPVPKDAIADAGPRLPPAQAPDAAS